MKTRIKDFFHSFWGLHGQIIAHAKYPGILLISLLMFNCSALAGDGPDMRALLGEDPPGFIDTNYNETISQLNMQLQLKPGNLFLRLMKIRVYLKHGKYDEALADSNSFMQDSDNPVGRAMRGYAYIGKADYQKAVDDFTYCINTKPIAASYFMRGVSYEGLGNYSNAISDYDSAVRMQPENAQFRLFQGNCNYSSGHLDRAIDDLSQAIRLAPNYATAYANRGFFFFSESDYTNAILDYDKAIDCDSKCDVALNNYAWVLSVCPDSNIRNGKKALEYAKQACDLTSWSRPECLGTLAAAYAETGQFADAIRWQTQAIQLGLSGKDLKEAQIRLGLYKQGKAWRVIK